MSSQDVDALALWDARARAVVSRLDAAIAGGSVPAPQPPLATATATDRLGALARRAAARTPAPRGEIVRPAAVNMGPQPDRIDPWDAYVCRFDEDTAERLPE